jgi:hypothetical protein
MLCGEDGLANPMTKSILGLGLLILSSFRAGGEVVQHVTLARLMPRGLTRAFVGLVICTHFTLLICNWMVPKALIKHSGTSSLAGLLHVQWMLMIPSAAGVVAAIWLVCKGIGKSESNDDQGPTIDDARWHRSVTAASLCSDGGKQKWVGRLLVSWAAISVGSLHALASITNGLVVSFGASPITAGNVVAQSQALALILLPVVGFVGDFVGRRLLLVLTSALALGACLTLSAGTVVHLPVFAWKISLFSLGIAGVLAPVLSLALIPQNLPKVAMAYGVVDTVKSLVQMLLMLVFGQLRERGGFSEAMGASCVPASVAMVLSVLLAFGINDVASSSPPRGNSLLCIEGHTPRGANKPLLADV